MEILSKISLFLFLHPYFFPIIILLVLCYFMRKFTVILWNMLELLEDLNEKLENKLD